MKCLTSCYAYEEVAASTSLYPWLTWTFQDFGHKGGCTNLVAPNIVVVGYSFNAPATWECEGPNECDIDTCHELPTIKTNYYIIGTRQ